MLWSLFENPAYFLLMIPAVLIALVVHEVSHGYAAYLCGDNTAKAYGRLTLNPLKHLDPFGAIMMMLTGFGYAKPVPVNYRNLRKPRRDIALVSLAGPLSNLLLALIACVLYFVILLVYASSAEVRAETGCGGDSVAALAGGDVRSGGADELAVHGRGARRCWPPLWNSSRCLRR